MAYAFSICPFFLWVVGCCYKTVPMLLQLGVLKFTNFLAAQAMEWSWFLWASFLLFTSLSSVLLFEIFVPVGCCRIWCHWALIVPLLHLISPSFVIKNLGWWGDSHLKKILLQVTGWCWDDYYGKNARASSGGITSGNSGSDCCCCCFCRF